MNRPTFGSVLNQHKGIGPGFDFLRVFLAAMVLLTHSIAVTRHGNSTIADLKSPLFDLRLFVVPAFFALSGFLVSASIFRVREVKVFLLLRSLRIFPALIMEIMLSALFLGLVVTTVPLSEYFASPMLWKYLANVFGVVIQYELPGVFNDNLKNTVNGSLWTVPSEMVCYISLAALMATGVIFKRKLLVGSFIAASIGLVAIIMLRHGRVSNPANHSGVIVLCFYAGVLLYEFRNRIPKSPVLLAMSLAIFYLCLVWSGIALVLLGPITIAYATCYVGMSEIRQPKLFSTGDYSYGVYLYGYPIQQTVVWVTGDSLTWWGNFLVAAVATLAVAAISWHLLEKPCLRLRKKLLTTPPKTSLQEAQKFIPDVSVLNQESAKAGSGT